MAGARKRQLIIHFVWLGIVGGKISKDFLFLFSSVIFPLLSPRLPRKTPALFFSPHLPSHGRLARGWTGARARRRRRRLGTTNRKSCHSRCVVAALQQRLGAATAIGRGHIGRQRQTSGGCNRGQEDIDSENERSGGQQVPHCGGHGRRKWSPLEEALHPSLVQQKQNLVMDQVAA